LGKDDAVLSRIVYSYNQAGKQTGYSIFDASGKLIGNARATSPSTPRKQLPAF